METTACCVNNAVKILELENQNKVLSNNITKLAQREIILLVILMVILIWLIYLHGKVNGMVKGCHIGDR